MRYLINEEYKIETMNKELLKEKIQKIEKKTSTKNWFQQLEDRKKEEAEFHDFSHHEETEKDNDKFYTTNQLSVDYVNNWLTTDCKNKTMLDYACGNGVQAVYVAKNSDIKFVIGIDISPLSVENARKLAKKEGVEEKCYFFVGDCENSELPDNCIDTVLCSGVLHHMDLNFVYPELHRIMKRGGKLFAVEALNFNPVIRAYRMRTPEIRTEWEKHHILDLNDVNKSKKYFDVVTIRYWHITSFMSAFISRIPWLFKPSLWFFNILDSVLTRIPYLQRLAWQFTFILVNKK